MQKSIKFILIQYDVYESNIDLLRFRGLLRNCNSTYDLYLYSVTILFYYQTLFLYSYISYIVMPCYSAV
jgi:hypothetical protein